MQLFLHNQTIAQEVLPKPTAGQKFKYLQACAQAIDKRVRQEIWCALSAAERND